MFPIVFDLIEQWLIAVTKGTKVMSNGNTATQLVPESDYAYSTMEEYHKPFNEPDTAHYHSPEEIETMLASLLATFKAMPGMVETVKRLENEIDVMRVKVDQAFQANDYVNGQLESAENARRSLSEECERHYQNNSDLMANYARLEAERDELRSERDTLSSDRNILRGKVEELEAKVAELEHDRSKREAEWSDGQKSLLIEQEQLSYAWGQLEAMTKDRDAANVECRRLTDGWSDTTHNLNRAESDLNTATDKLARLREVLLS